jgi:YVTN family beta-propeller protein
MCDWAVSIDYFSRFWLAVTGGVDLRTSACSARLTSGSSYSQSRVRRTLSWSPQQKLMRTARQGAAMRRFRWVRGVVAFGLAGALMGVVPDGVSAVPARSRCRATAFVTNSAADSVSTIDVKTRRKNPTDIPVGAAPLGVGITPDGKTAFVTNVTSGTVSTIDVKTRTKHPDDIPVGSGPNGVAVTPDGKTAFVPNLGSDSVSTIDVKTRTKDPTDIPVGSSPFGVAITPCRR